MKRPAALVLLLGVVGALAAWFLHSRGSPGLRVTFTAGELQVMHAGVEVGARPVHGLVRLAVGDVVKVGPEGRARLRLDDGTTAVLDRATVLSLGERGLALDAGRLFVQGGAAARTEVAAGPASAVVSASAVAFTRTPEKAHAYCADGEVVVSAFGKQERVRTGETATAAAGGLRVVPEKAFNDWTAGLATPWSAAGRPKTAVGELWGRLSSVVDEEGTPLAVRAHEVEAHIEGEVAATFAETTFFNGGSDALTGDFRMALPEGAIVSRFALRRGGKVEEGVVLAGKASGMDVPRLEWAGPGWLRGTIPGIGTGDTIGVIVEYVEWLSAQGGHLTYRYPMVSEGTPPLIGELRAKVDASGASPRRIAASRGATTNGAVVEWRRADLRPEADLVVDLDVEERAKDRVRAYVAEASSREAGGDPYILVRAEPPSDAAPRGVTLAVVLDTSFSVAPSLLDAERAVVEALLEGLGSEDRLVVLAADQGSRFVGGSRLAPVDDKRRRAMREELAMLRSGGASDLGAALEDAADTLPADAPDAAVVYVGDGLPTQGDADADAVRARLARRAAGVPRIAAVALGPLADRATLTALVHGSGPVVEVEDRDDAAQAAIGLLGGLLEPAVSGVELDLGPTVDRIYPRGAQTVAARGSVMVVGRLRGRPPTTATLSFRRTGRVVSEPRMVERVTTAKVGDVRRRWAKARVDDIVLRGESKETAADIAERARLVTPWTGWFVASGATSVQSAPVLDRSVDPSDAALLYGLGPAARRRGALLEPEPPRIVGDDEEDFATLVRAAAGRTLDGAMAGVRRCRAARAALRPDATGKLRITLTIDGRGRPSRIVVRATEPVDDDPALDRCVQALIGSLSFFDSGTTSTITVEHDLPLPPPRDQRARRCSDTSVLPLPLRVGVWRERLKRGAPADAYLRAKRGCELASFTDQRALLELILAQVPSGVMRLVIAKSLDDAAEVDAAAYLRKAAVERAENPEELRAVRLVLIGAEPLPGPTFKKQYLAAHDDEARLAVVRRFLGLSPHDPTFRRLVFSLLESLGRKDVLAQEIEAARRDLFTDAALLADGASALLRIGRRDEARRAFGELIERAPYDPFAYAYTGDRLRDEGLFDEATSAYEVLGRLLPGDPSAALRLSLAHAGAGRLDVATRVLGRVAATGGRSGDVALSELASVAASVLLADARAHASGSDLSALEQRALEVPLPDVAGMVLVRSPTLDVPVEPRVVRGQSDLVPDLSAPSLGLFAMRLERGEGEVRIRLRRPPALEPGRDTRVRVDVLALGEDLRVERLVEKEVVLPADGKDHELRWDGKVLL